ncbi:MAG TPA: hypothetical protein DEQ80_10460 [Anaerolinea thermolimosa]|uniref:DUF4760 domain-containing protein n=1 Tax=Anaerolinea thermolimosa TaxID=229919 RepID=A0A3D1JI62_9CHLR|nr:hypothetical protein [Anaerolinea thermolimosa]GAP05371.1 hypothetical protein ATHL_00202 [Anaerolinea thermolimosa]HCE18270.1 hypothetical protein [Anaerolinea thermolimosa]
MNADFASIKDLFELLSYVAILLGIPTGLYQYYRSVKKEQQDREYGTYNALDEKYLQFLKLCFENPELDVFEVPDAAPQPLNETQKKQELIALTMLLSICERAYLMYSDQSTAVKRRQWSGWDGFIRDYCRRENFRRALARAGEGFDLGFQAYIRRVLAEVETDALNPGG